MVILLVKAECSSNSHLLALHPTSFPTVPRRFQIRSSVCRAEQSAAEAELKIAPVAMSGPLAFHSKNAEICIQCCENGWGEWVTLGEGSHSNSTLVSQV